MIFPPEQTVKQWSKAKIVCFSQTKPSWLYKQKEINQSRYRNYLRRYSFTKKQYKNKDYYNYTLIINHVGHTDIGKYECLGRNNFGIRFMAVSTLHVKGTSNTLKIKCRLDAGSLKIK